MLERHCPASHPSIRLTLPVSLPIVITANSCASFCTAKSGDGFAGAAVARTGVSCALRDTFCDRDRLGVSTGCRGTPADRVVATHGACILQGVSRRTDKRQSSATIDEPI